MFLSPNNQDDKKPKDNRKQAPEDMRGIPPEERKPERLVVAPPFFEKGKKPDRRVERPERQRKNAGSPGQSHSADGRLEGIAPRGNPRDCPNRQHQRCVVLQDKRETPEQEDE